VGPPTFYLDVDRLTAALLAMAEGEDEQRAAKTVKGVLADLGVDAIKAVGAGMRVHRKGLLYSLVVYAPDMPDKGLWKLTAPVRGGFASPRVFPANVLSFSAQSFDWAAAWRLGMAMFAKHAPDQFNKFTQQKTGFEQGLQINLEQDLIASIGLEMAGIMAEGPPAPSAPPGAPRGPAEAMANFPDMLYYVALKDAKKFEAAFEKLLMMAGQMAGGPAAEGAAPSPPFKVEEFRGFKLRILATPIPGGMQMVLCVTPDALMYALGRGAVSKMKATLRNLGGGESLAANPAFKRPLDLLPKEGRVAVFFLDVPRFVELFAKQAAEAVEGFDVELGGDDREGEAEEGKEKDKVEELKKVLALCKKYLRPMVGVMLKERDGFTVQTYVH